MAVLSLITFICPAIGFFIILILLIGNFNHKFPENFKKMYIPIAFIAATCGYALILRGEYDLTRYFYQLDYYTGASLSYILEQGNGTSYTKDIWFYFVKLTGNVHMLPYMSALGVYGLVSYVIFDCINRSEREFTVAEVCELLLIALFVISPFSIINNIRCVFSYVIISFATYRDLVQKKKNLLTYVLYIIPIGLHSSAIVILLFRILQVLVKKLGRGIAIVAAFVPTFITFFYEHIDLFGSSLIGLTFSNAINMAYAYLNDAIDVNPGIFDFINRAYGTFFIVLIIILLFVAKSYVRKNKNLKDPFYEPMVSYLYLVGIGALGCLYIVAGAFWRFEAVVVLFSPLIFVPLMEMGIPVFKRAIHLLLGLMIIPLIPNVIEFKMATDITETIVSFFTTTGFEILYYTFIGLYKSIV